MSHCINIHNVVSKIFKYFLMGMFLAIIAYTVPAKKIDGDSILLLAISSSFIYSVLDMYIFEREL